MSERRLLSLGTNTFKKTINYIQKFCIWSVNAFSMGRTQAFMSIYLQIMKSFVFVHLLSSFGGVIFDNKIWAALRST